MIGAKTTYLSNKLLDHVLGGSAYTPPTTIYFALFVSLPTDAGGGIEVSGNGYTRAAVANDGTTWSAAGNASKVNNIQIDFPIAVGDWGNIVAVGIFDASVDGNMLYWVDTSFYVLSGDVTYFEAGAITVTED